MQRIGRKRNGMTILAAVICLVMVTLLLASMMRILSTSAARSRLELHRLQSEWLAEAGEQRARVQSQRHPGYEGESWNIHTGNGPTAMQITIARQDAPNQFQVYADISQSKRRITRTTRTFLIQTGTTDEE